MLQFESITFLYVIISEQRSSSVIIKGPHAMVIIMSVLCCSREAKKSVIAVLITALESDNAVILQYWPVQ